MGELQTSTDFSVRPDEAIGFLRVIPLLQQLPEDSLKKLCEAVRPVRYGPGESIVRLNMEGAGFYFIWSGEAKVTSPPSPYPLAHKESILKRDDYFGLMGPLKRTYQADVVAINEVVCLVLGREDVHLLSSTSVWDWSSLQHEGPSVMDQMMQLETVGAVGDMKMKSPGFPNFVSPYQQATRRAPAPSIPKVNYNYFGGQLVCQALMAATRTVNPELLVNSMHSYFIQTANVNFSTVYEVEVIRDGRTFATRHVRAKQNEKLVYVLYASFKREEKALEYTEPMPSVPPPEEVIGTEQIFEDYLTDPRLPLDAKREYVGFKFPLLPFDQRVISDWDKFLPVKVVPPRQLTWIRSRSKISAEQNVHRCVAAYATDLSLVETSLKPHPETLGVAMQVLSLDHAIWFHGSFDAGEWLLYVMESPISFDGRGLAWGKLYTQDGRLVMTVAQEGVLRKMDDDGPKLAKL